MAALLMMTALPGHAALVSFVAGMTCSGSAPFDAATDPGGCPDNTVSTYDTATYLVGFSNTVADTNIVITATLPTTPILGGATLPPYSGAPITQSAYFKLTDLDPNCENVSATPVAPNSGTQSGVTADGTQMICVIASRSAQNLLFKMTIAGLPNGSAQPAPTFTYRSATLTPAVTAAPIADAAGTPPTYGLPTLTTAAAARWNLAKSAPSRAFFVPGSGPSGEDGYVLVYNLGIYAQGSRKGLEPLDPASAVITDNYNDVDAPNARLINWNMQSAFVNADLSASGQNGCGDWRNQFRLGNAPLDNNLQKPQDYPGAAAQNYAVANGGSCNATVVDNVAKSATLTVTGTDYSLKQYPIYHDVQRTTTLINTNNLDDPNNQWWVASKSVLIWAPTSDFTPNVQETFTNKATLVAHSITGQPNVEPVLTDNSADYGVLRTNSGGFSKRWRMTGQAYRNLAPTPPCDPSVTGDCVIQSASPGQFVTSYMAIANQGTDAIVNSTVCDKFDNARVTFVDARAYPPVSPNGVHDPLTGISTYFYLGPVNSTGVVWELGVGGTGVNPGGTWTSMSQQIGYSVPSLTTSTQATSGCGDADATWYPSIDALIAAGHAMSEVNRVRGKIASMPASVQLLLEIPFLVNSTYTYATNDINGAASQGPFPVLHAAGDSTLGVWTGTTLGSWDANQAQWDATVSLNRTYKDARSLRIWQDEYATISKSSTTHPVNGQQVSTGTVVTYALKVNLTTSSTAGHSSTVTITDVLPRYVSYLGGTAQYGGVAIAAIPGATESCTPNAPVANVTQCVWTIPNQPVTPGAVGIAAGNLPTLTFNAFVDAAAPNGTALLNSSKVHTPGNTYGEPATYTPASGFTCAANAVCSVGNWTLNVTATAGVVLSKTVDSAVVSTDTGFSYSLFYSAVGQDIVSPGIVDVLPYAGDARNPPSNYVGSLQLAGPIAAPIAGTSPVTQPDPNIKLYFTSNAPANVSRLPFAASQDYSGLGANTPAHTVWCMQAQFGVGACPAGFGSVTAFAAMPAGQDGSFTLHMGESYKLVVPVLPIGNAAGNAYSNGFVLDSPSLVAHNPGSNVVSTLVVSPDLLTTKTAPATATAGGAIVYSLAVKNNTVANNPNVGPVLATPPPSIVVTDTLPPGITFAAASDVGGTNWDCSASTPPSTVSCTYDNSGLPIPIGGQVGGFIAINATVAGTVGNGAVSVNQACVALAGQSDSVAANNCGSSTTTMAQRPDLRLSKVAAPGGASTMDYAVTVENVGISASSNPFTVTDTIPAGVRVDSVTGAGVSCAGLPFTGDGSAQMTCTVATQLAGTGADANGNPIGSGGGTVTFTYSTTLLPNYVGEINTACANDGLDVVAGNNCGSSAPQPLITHNKSISSGPTATGNLYEYSITYSIVVTNNGVGAGDYDLSDTLNYSAAVSIGAIDVTLNGSALPGPFSTVNQTPNVLASALPLAPGGLDTYLVTVLYTVLPGQVTPINGGCSNTLASGPGNGTLNVSALTTSGSTTSADACAPIVVPTGELTVTKSVSGGPAGYSGSFAIDVACTVNGDAVTPLEGNSQTIAAGTGSDGTVSFTGIPQGAVCTVSEGTLPTLPVSYVWVAGTPTITQPGAIAATPATANVVNTMVQQVAGLTVIKTVTGGPSTYSGSFPVSVACTVNGGPVTGITPSATQTATAGTSASGSVNFGNIPQGSACTVSEGTLPTAPAGYTWGTPAITQPGAIAATGSTATVANTLSQQFGSLAVTKTVTGGPASYSGSFPITAACTFNGAPVTGITPSATQAAPAGTGTPGTVTFANIPQGATCTISEGALPAPPASYTFGTPSITQPSAAIGASPGSASVLNTLSQQFGSLIVTKSVSGAPTGYSGAFPITAACVLNGVPVTGITPSATQTVTAGTGTPGTATFANIPQGATCTISEGTLPTAPSSYAWVAGTPTITQPVGAIAATPVTASVVNTMAQQVAGLTVVKTVAGGPAAYSDSFPISVVCTLDGNPVTGITPSATQNVTAGSGTSGSVNFANIPEGSSCTVSEGALPAAPTGYTWGTPAITQSGAIAATGSTATVANTLTTLDPPFHLIKTVTGGPSTLNGTFVFDIDCGTAGAFTQSVTLANATSGSVAISNIPFGSVCVFSEASNLPAAPDGFAWGAPPTAQSKTIDGSDVSFINTLIADDTPPTPPRAVPALRDAMLALLALLMIGVGVRAARSRQRRGNGS